MTRRPSTLGEQLKAEGIELALHNPGNVPWLIRARHALYVLAAAGQPFTSEDITARVGQPPSSGAVGALMNAASREHAIQKVGRRKAIRQNQHAAEISEWQGTGRVPNPDQLLADLYAAPPAPPRPAQPVFGRPETGRA